GYAQFGVDENGVAEARLRPAPEHPTAPFPQRCVRSNCWDDPWGKDRWRRKAYSVHVDKVSHPVQSVLPKRTLLPITRIAYGEGRKVLRPNRPARGVAGGLTHALVAGGGRPEPVVRGEQHRRRVLPGQRGAHPLAAGRPHGAAAVLVVQQFDDAVGEGAPAVGVAEERGG